MSIVTREYVLVCLHLADLERYASNTAALKFVALLNDVWQGLATTCTLLFIPFVASLLQFACAHNCM